MDRILRYFEIPSYDADDVLQTVALFALQRWSDIQYPAPWLIATLRKRCVLYYRARRLANLRYTSLQVFAPDFGAPLPTAPSPAGRLETRVDLRRLLQRLSPTQCLLLAARYRLGMVDHEAAQVTGLAATSIRKLTTRALSDLRDATPRRWRRNRSRKRMPRK